VCCNMGVAMCVLQCVNAAVCVLQCARVAVCVAACVCTQMAKGPKEYCSLPLHACGQRMARACANVLSCLNLCVFLCLHS